jgi:hypothetical protein
VPEPEGATDSAMHGPDAARPQVRLSRTHARNTPPPGRATGSAPGRPGASTIRSALEIAKERWGTPVGAVTVQNRQPRQPGDGVAVNRDPLVAWRIWSEPSPPMSGIWADLIDGARLQADHGWGWLIPYWLFGIPSFAAACLARVLLDSSARPGRFAALLVAALLFIVGLYVAGAI